MVFQKQKVTALGVDGCLVLYRPILKTENQMVRQSPAARRLGEFAGSNSLSLKGSHYKEAVNNSFHKPHGHWICAEETRLK